MKEPSTEPALDRTDLAILRILQSDGRIGNASLAARLGLSPASCHRRVSRLRREGVIADTVSRIAPARVGLGAMAIVGVVLDRSTPDSFSAFEKAVAELPFVLDCHLVAGDFDYFMKIRVRDISHFNRMHGERLIALPGVRQTRTFFVLKEVRDGGLLDF